MINDSKTLHENLLYIIKTFLSHFQSEMKQLENSVSNITKQSINQKLLTWQHAPQHSTLITAFMNIQPPPPPPPPPPPSSLLSKWKKIFNNTPAPIEKEPPPNFLEFLFNADTDVFHTLAEEIIKLKYLKLMTTLKYTDEFNQID